MAILKCNMCGGTLMYDGTQNLAICPYCDSKSTVYEQDRKLFEQFGFVEVSHPWDEIFMERTL